MMTFDDMREQVCAKVGQIDSRSLSLCGDFLNSRYVMIYDSENWQDTLDFADATSVIGDPIVPIPATLNRVLSVRYAGGILLEKVDIPFLLDLNLALDQPGTPKYYTEELVAGVQSIRLWPVPDSIQAIKFWGKKALDRLSIGDSPIIRNIENCLMAFVQGDMLERARQYAKAKAKIEEAGAMLELMRKVENQNSNLPRKSKNLTVAGDSLAEMVDAVCCRIGDYSAPTQIMVKEYLRRNYVDVYDSQLWPESRVPAYVTRDDSEVVLPEYFDQVISVRANPDLPALMTSDEVADLAILPQGAEESGSPVRFNILTPVAVATLPPANEKINFVSSDPLDTSPIFVRGETGGVEVSETVVLNGIIPVPTVYSYDTPLTISKQLTTGFVDVSSVSTNTFLVRLLADERERKHVRIWLRPTPGVNDGTVCLVLGKRRIKPLLTDEDTPILRGMGNILIQLAISDYFTQAGNEKGAEAAQKKAGTALQTLLDRETKQSAFAPRVIPYMGGAGYGSEDYAYGCWSKLVL